MAKTAAQVNAERKPKVGDRVYCNGEACEVVELVSRFNPETGEPVQGIRYESETKKIYGLVRDLIYDPELGAWYLWGRVLSAAQVAVVVELRDRGLLKARATRIPSSAPAAGEHHQLYLALFHNADHELWPAAMSSIRTGGGVPKDAAARIADLAKRFTKKLEHGYADRGADDSVAEG
jgi:hypothetical protein